MDQTEMTDFSLHFPTGLTEPTADDNVDVRIELTDGRAFSVSSSPSLI
jgi:hypothetical protein